MSELPHSWQMAEIGWLCNLVNGRAFKPSDWTEDGLPIVRIQNLNNSEAPFNRYSGQVEDKFLIDNGQLLFAWSGTPGTSFGAHIWNRGKAILNQHIFKVEFNECYIDKSYFRYAINQKLQELIDKAHGGVGLGHVTKGKFEETKIELPPLAEQRRIVAKLDSLFAHTRRARAELEHIPPLVEHYKQAILAAAFRGDLTKDWRLRNPQNESFEMMKSWLEEARYTAVIKAGAKRYQPSIEPDWFPDIELPEGWGWCSVDQLASLVQYGSSAQTTELSENGISVLRMGNIVDGKLDFTKLKYLPEDHEEFPELLLSDGDVLFNRTNSAELVGKTAVYKHSSEMQASFASYLIRLKTVGILPELLSAYINSSYGRQWVASVASQQVGQANVNGTKLRQLAVPVMPDEEQVEVWRHIQNAFDHIEALNMETSQARLLLDHLDQAYLTKAFRGELVPQDPNDEPAAALLERIRTERASQSMGKGKSHNPKKFAEGATQLCLL